MIQSHTNNRAIALVLAAVAISLGFGPASTAVQKVREGLRHFTGGEFEAAGKAFTEADVAEPENSTISFDRACALAATGDVEKATELFRQAALARDTDLAARSHYNLGCLSAEQGRATRGEDPSAAAQEQRQQALSLLLAAVGHYRDCLRLNSEHSDARHNLELIRVFIKHIQAVWEQQDREKAREEMGLLEFLAMIEQRQTALRSTVRILNEESNSPQRRQRALESSDEQTLLQDEIEPLKEKITAELQTAHQTPPGSTNTNPDPGAQSQTKQALKLLTQLADESGKLMTDAAAHIDSAEFADAEEKQRDVLDRLNQIFMVVAPFSNVLQRATQQQEQLTGTSESLTAPDDVSGSPDETENENTSDDEAGNDDPVGSTPDVDHQDLQWQQSRVTDWSRMLSLKAESELPQVESQLQAAQAQQPQTDPTQPPDDDDPANPHGTGGDTSAQLEALKKSLQKAVELAPKVQEHSTSAAELLGESNVPGALPDQQEALKLLREIAEPLAQQNRQQDDQQNGDGDEGNQNEQPQQQPDQKQQQQTGQSPQERSMSVLRRARERERQHRDLQKQLQQMIGGRVRVDRDW